MHDLHKEIGDIISERLGSKCEILKDPACARSGEIAQNIPLFMGQDKGRESQLCKVDMIIIKDTEIKAIIEIEESNVKPMQILGKYLTSVFADSFIHDVYKDKIIRKSDGALFLQILNSKTCLKSGSKKTEQWDIIKNKLMKWSKSAGCGLDYDLLYGTCGDFKSGKKSGEKLISKLIGCIDT